MVQSLARIEYNASTGEYFIGGERVTLLDIEAILEQESRRNESLLLDLFSLLVANQITLAEFQAQVLDIIKESTIRGMVFAAGGDRAFRSNPLASEYLTQVREQNKDIATGFARVSDLMRAGQRTEGQIRNYLRRMARAPRQAYSDSQSLNRLEGSPANEARRQLDPDAKHCPSCPLYETDDYVPIEDVVPVGFACECGGNCRCFITYRFNPLRALQNLGSGATLEDRLNRRRENLAQTQSDYLDRLAMPRDERLQKVVQELRRMGRL